MFSLFVVGTHFQFLFIAFCFMFHLPATSKAFNGVAESWQPSQIPHVCAFYECHDEVGAKAAAAEEGTSCSFLNNLVVPYVFNHLCCFLYFLSYHLCVSFSIRCDGCRRCRLTTGPRSC